MSWAHVGTVILALVALHLLRDRDGWALDTWLAWRRSWRVVR